MEGDNSMIVKELETAAVGERNESSQPDKITFKEYLQVRCRISYQMRKLKTKGAILVLIWSFIVVGVFNYLLNSLLVSYSDSVITSVVTIIGVTLPVAGWLADVRFGRYRVMRCSIWTMWISSLLLTTVYIVFSFVEFNHSGLIRNILTILVVVLLVFGIGGFQAIVIQFGIDQLNDASTTEITSFVAWYTWTLTSSNIVASFISIITCIDSKYDLMGPLVIAMCLTVVVSTNYLFSNQLIKEPVTQNPFKLVYKVVRYAIKTKHPQQRSAFTYWEDDLPSRMDFGKIKYGGPFTTEQVEDVKILIKTMGIIILALTFLVPMEHKFLEHEIYTTYIAKLFGKHHTKNVFYRCFSKDLLTNVHTIIGLLLIPLNEFLIYPLFYRYISIKIRWKILLSTLILLAGLVVLTILITYAGSKYIETKLPYNYTFYCLSHEKPNSLTNDIIDHRWFILVEFLFTVSYTMLMIGLIEYFCAQVPYSMKGLVAGYYYGCIGLCVMFNYGLSRIFTAKLHIWESNTTFNCEFWYLLTKIIPVAMAAFMVALAIKYHKKRKREDVLPSEHIFAEQYYSAH